MPKRFRLKVSVNLIDGEYVITKIDRSMKILTLKEKLEYESGIPSHLLQLYYLDECELRNDDSVNYYHILPDATLNANIFWPWRNLMMAVKRNCIPDTMRHLAAIPDSCCLSPEP